jgi:cysteine synthase A
MRFVGEWTGRSVGASTGTSLWGALRLVAEMRAAGQPGSVVTLICDSGERYAGTYDNQDWLSDRELDPGPYAETLHRLMATGEWREPSQP